MPDIIQSITEALTDILKADGVHLTSVQHDKATGEVVPSDRRDLSDWQTNIAMVLAAQEHFQNPQKRREAQIAIAEKIVVALQKDIRIQNIDGLEIFIEGQTNPDSSASGMINFRFPQSLENTRPTIMLDYGGANIGKTMHIGHLRTCVQGEVLSRLSKALGHTVISDSHLGDWGLQMGQIIAQLEEEYPHWPVFRNPPETEGFQLPLPMQEFRNIYPRAAKKFKSTLPEHDAFRDKCRHYTAMLQNGEHKGFQLLWEQFRKLSVGKLAQTLDTLGVSFDIWGGESDVHAEIDSMIEALRQKGLVRESEGMLIMDVEENGDGMPPLILKNSAGAVSYAATDLATIRQRIREHHPDRILYFVDSRQSLHFKQVFRAAKLAGYNVHLEHVPLGTYNGPDGKPFKTRDGTVAELQEVLESVKQQVRDDTTTPEDDVSDVAASVLIWEEVRKNRATNTTFFQNEDYVADLSGKSAIYLYETYDRICKLAKTPSRNNDSEPSLSEEEKQLTYLIHLQRYYMERAFKLCSSHILADYTYDVAQAFQAVFPATEHRKAPDVSIRTRNLALETEKVMRECADILGIRLKENIGRTKREIQRSSIHIANNVHTKMRKMEQQKALTGKPVPRPEVTPLSKKDYDAFKGRCLNFKSSLLNNKDKIIKALSAYEPEATARDEIDLAIRCIDDVCSSKYEDYFTGKIPKISAFLHANLPIYYFVVLAALPSAMAEEVYLRPNQHMQDKQVIRKLREAGVDFDAFPNISILDRMGRKEFLEDPVGSSDLVIVNGSYEAARHTVQHYMKEGATLVSEGKHHDPFVVTSTADIDYAVERAVHLKSYNSGQECAAPDAILVHADVAEEFIRKFTEKFKAQKTGPSFRDPEVMFGQPIGGREDIERARYYGADIDDAQGIIKPTVQVSDLSDEKVSPNFDEMFSPLQFIHIYHNQQDLDRYFNDPRYAVDKGYVSVFCNTDKEVNDPIRDYLITRNDDTITNEAERDRNGIGRLLFNRTIHNELQDNANDPFGAHSCASFVMRIQRDERGYPYIRTSGEPISHTDVIKRYLVEGQEVRNGGTIPDMPVLLPDLTQIAPHHSILGNMYATYATPARLENEREGITPPPMDIICVLGDTSPHSAKQRNIPSPSAQAEAEQHIKRALQAQHITPGKITFVTRDYVERYKNADFDTSPPEVIQTMIAIAHPETHTFAANTPNLWLQYHAREQLNKWKMEVIEQLPAPLASWAKQQTAVDVVMAATTRSKKAEIISNPIIPIPSHADNRNYHMTFMRKEDYKDLLSLAKHKDFYFAPLNAMKDTNGKKMRVAGKNGSVRKYLHDLVQSQDSYRKHYVFAIRDEQGKLIGGVELLNLAPSRNGNGNEVEIGLFVSPDYAGKLPIPSILKETLKWAYNHLDVQSFYATAAPDNRGIMSLLAKVHAELDPTIDVETLPYLAPNKKDSATRVGLRVNNIPEQVLKLDSMSQVRRPIPEIERLKRNCHHQNKVSQITSRRAG